TTSRRSRRAPRRRSSGAGPACGWQCSQPEYGTVGWQIQPSRLGSGTPGWKYQPTPETGGRAMSAHAAEPIERLADRGAAPATGPIGIVESAAFKLGRLAPLYDGIAFLEAI